MQNTETGKKTGLVLQHIHSFSGEILENNCVHAFVALQRLDTMRHIKDGFLISA